MAHPTGCLYIKHEPLTTPQVLWSLQGLHNSMANRRRSGDLCWSMGKYFFFNTHPQYQGFHKLSSLSVLEWRNPKHQVTLCHLQKQFYGLFHRDYNPPCVLVMIVHLNLCIVDRQRNEDKRRKRIKMCAFADKKNVRNRINKKISWEWLKIDHCYYTHSTAALIMAAFTMEDYHQLFIWMIPIIYIQIIDPSLNGQIIVN